MSATDLNSHAQALYSLLLRPVANSSPSWKEASDNIRQLADCMTAYRNYLKEQLEVTLKNQNLDHPVRTVHEHATVEHKKETWVVKGKYALLDAELRSANLLTPVFFDESKHLSEPFKHSMERLRFINDMQLSVPIDIYRYCPGGSHLTSLVIVKTTNDRSEAQILTDGARLMQQLSPNLNEFHTRQQKKEFKEKIAYIANISPAVRDYIYRNLTMDASAANNPVLQDRLRLICLGYTGIVDDLRHLNKGRPQMFDLFFEKMEEVIEEVTAADERRHNIAHISEWVSLRELIAQTRERLPSDVPVPSASLVRLQFAPRNAYTHRAMNFTSRINVQYKIQRRQLRASHPDDHFCAAQLKYLKAKAIEMKAKSRATGNPSVLLLCCDDKAKVPVGEPNTPVSTGVRGKKTLAPSSTTLAALDHDMTRASLTPSVILRCEIPESVEKSFVQGQVTTVVGDSVFESSNPFRHAVNVTRLAKIENRPKVLMKFTDGGTDQRNNLESVKLSNICLFKEMDLDMLIHARCAPGHSWTNPAERIMSILNIGLQNCSLEREKVDTEAEKLFKRCGGMADLRALAENKPEVKTSWRESIEPVQSKVRNRFLRLKLKEVPVQALDPATEAEIEDLKQPLKNMFPDLDLTKLQKVHTSKVKSYQEWCSLHCRARHYCFQIRKCTDQTCCSPTENLQSDLTWLPDPVLDRTGEHYMKYEEVKDTETTENDRPSLKIPPKPPRREKGKSTEVADAGVPVAEDEAGVEVSVPHFLDEPSDDAHLFVAQHARTTVDCIECGKPRVLYSKHALSERQQVSVAIAVSECEYTCGAQPLNPIGIGKIVKCRSHMGCATPVELSYYTIGRADKCAWCGADEGAVDADLKKKFKTVLPICPDCVSTGHEAIVRMPYGKQNKKQACV